MGQRFLALYWPEGLDSAKILEDIDDLARKDGRSRSWVIREAMKEYLSQHYPGNPQTDLRVFSGLIEPPKTMKSNIAIESERQRRAQDIYFLVKRGITLERATKLVDSK